MKRTAIGKENLVYNSILVVILKPYCTSLSKIKSGLFGS